MHLAAGILSGAAILIVLWDAFETIILPRRVTRRIRLTSAFYRLTWRPWSAIARRIHRPRRRESVLAYFGPLSVLFLLTVWAGSMIFGFAGLHWALGTRLISADRNQDFLTYLYMSGTDYFTLGLGDVTAAAAGPGRALTVFEAGLGFGFLAIVIGYFPVLYQAFSRREVNIALLDARAGSPSSALELLRHFSETRALDQLDLALHEFEHWTAELLESHISYPVLSYFRSQHDNQSWLGATTTVLDACALTMAGIGGIPSRQAQLTFAMARHAVVDIAQILHRPPRAPEPDRLPPEALARLRGELAAMRLDLASDGDAEARLNHLRGMYEPYVNALARYLAMRLPEWAPERRATHNWETSAWGRAAAAPRAARQRVDDDHA
jgi:Ion channel